MNSFFIISTYCTGSGRSRPKSCRTARSVCGVAFFPAIRAAGSVPGVAKKIRKTKTLIANITRSAEAIRLTTKRSISGVA